jgi:hypothetical protein
LLTATISLKPLSGGGVQHICWQNIGGVPERKFFLIHPTLLAVAAYRLSEGQRSGLRLCLHFANL